MEMVILRFCSYTGVILETQELFPKTYYTHKPIFVPVYGILEYARTLGFGRILPR